MLSAQGRRGSATRALLSTGLMSNLCLAILYLGSFLLDLRTSFLLIFHDLYRISPDLEQISVAYYLEIFSFISPVAG